MNTSVSTFISESTSECEKICNVLGCFEDVSGKSTNKTFCEKHIPKYKLNDPEDCSICMEKLTYKTHLQCGHCFHDDCIDTWLSTHNTCPICRQNCNDWDNDIKYQLGYPVLERSDGYYNERDNESESDDESNEFSEINISYVQNNGNDFDNWINEQIVIHTTQEYHTEMYSNIVNNNYFLRQCFIYFYNKENIDPNEISIFFNFIKMSI